MGFGSGRAINIDRILAWECEEADFVVEQQTIGAQFLFGHAIAAFDVGVTLSADRVTTVWLLALAAEVFRLHLLLLHLLVTAQELLFATAHLTITW